MKPKLGKHTVNMDKLEVKEVVRKVKELNNIEVEKTYYVVDGSHFASRSKAERMSRMLKRKTRQASIDVPQNIIEWVFLETEQDVKDANLNNVAPGTWVCTYETYGRYYSDDEEHIETLDCVFEDIADFVKVFKDTEAYKKFKESL